MTAAAVVASLGWPRLASAQTVTVQPNSLTRSLGFRPDSQEPTWLSYSDCTGDDELTFETTLSGAVGYSMEVWVGSSVDCTPYDARLGSSPTCWQVYKASPQSITASVTMRVQDIIAQKKSSSTTGWGPDSGTIADCDTASGPTEGQAITLYFMLVDSTGQPAGTGSRYETKYDLIGPPAPTGISAGIGENRLIVSWDDASQATDLIGYRAYCDQSSTTAPVNQPMAADSGVDGAAGAAGGGGAAGSDASPTSTDAGSDASTDSGAGGSDGAAGTGGGSGGNPECPSAALVPGERPDSSYKCGSVTSKTATDLEATGLDNNVSYAVAVAGVDRVGNSGPLSDVACGTPQEVDDFFELYRRAGGKGGGGFCALAADPAPGVLALLGGAWIAFVIRRRRRSC